MCSTISNIILQWHSKNIPFKAHSCAVDSGYVDVLDRALFLWVQIIWLKTLRRTTNLAKLSRMALELRLQTADNQPHLVFSSLKRFQLHSVEDVQQRGGQQDGDAQGSQHVEGDAGERLICVQGQPRHSDNGQLQKEQSQAHHPSTCCCGAHPLSTVQAHFDFSTSLRDNVD